MGDEVAINTLVDAAKTVLEETGAPERLDELKTTARQRRERSDMLWFELILSMATWGNSSGSDLATNEEYYSQVKYNHLLPMGEDKRIGHLKDVLHDAGVRYQNKKSRYISSHIDRIEEKGGLEITQEEFESQDGKDAKMDFLREFKGIGDKYARNIGMDIFHPDFRDTIALDNRINGISDELGVEFDSYEEHEQFYVDVAERLGMTAWELDRLLYRYTDDVTAHIAE